MIINKKYIDYIPYFAWIISMSAMLGSLYYSDIKGFAPCILCWYQRIAIYALSVIIPVGIYRKDDSHMPFYVLALSIGGMLISIFHNLLYYGIIPERVAPCVNGISCTTKYVEYFGFISIPLLSLMAFALIIVLMWVYARAKK